jgi:hypothetical protein
MHGFIRIGEDDMDSISKDLRTVLSGNLESDISALGLVVYGGYCNRLLADVVLTFFVVLT